MAKTGRPRSCTLDESAFDRITPESARWIGFLFGDGALLVDGEGRRRLAVNLAARDREHLEKLRAFLKSTHAISEMRYKERRIGGSFVTESRAVGFRVRSERLAMTLEKFGMARYKKDRRPDDNLIMNTAFWAGVVDADGSIGNTKVNGHVYVTFHLCGHEPLISAFQNFLVMKHEISLMRTKTSSGIWRVQTTGRHARRLVELFYANGTGTALQRKLERARAVLRGERIAAY